MKCVVVLLCVCVLGCVCVGLLLLVQLRTATRLELQAEQRERSLRARTSQAKELLFSLEVSRKYQVKPMRKEVSNLQALLNNMTTKAESMGAAAQACQDAQTGLKEAVAAVQKEKAEADGSQGSQQALSGEITALRQQLQQPSRLCDFVKADSAEGKKLCLPKEGYSTADTPPVKAQTPADGPNTDAPKTDAAPKK